MHVLVRADASPHIGHGHVARCLALSYALQRHGAKVWFATRCLPATLSARLHAAGHAEIVLPKPASPGERTDLEETIAACDQVGLTPHWVIVDHYGLSATWEDGWKARGARVLVVDDLADRSHVCDLLLDQNLVAGMRHRYDRLVPASVKRLLGPSYALLAPEYAALAAEARPRSFPPRRALLSFGGGDASAVTSQALEAVLTVPGAHLALDVVGQVNESAFDFVADIGAESRVRFLGGLPSLATLSLEADFAFGAGGSTSWERFCVGLPMIIASTAPNQRPVAKELQRRGLIMWLGDADMISVATMREALASFIASPWGDVWWEKARALVDGRGAERVAEAMVELGTR
jgi:UDP-2,4-diacetamido-2,4,6-trideoxy-beta-L-altropyranose hydrolase